MIVKCGNCGFEWDSKRRGLQANEYAHLIIGRIADHTGDTFIGVKNMLKYEGGFFSEVKEHTSSEKVVVALEETHTMNSARMSEFVEFAYLFANSIGVNILTPEEYYESLNSEVKPNE